MHHAIGMGRRGRGRGSVEATTTCGSTDGALTPPRKYDLRKRIAAEGSQEPAPSKNSKCAAGSAGSQAVASNYTARGSSSVANSPGQVSSSSTSAVTAEGFHPLLDEDVLEHVLEHILSKPVSMELVRDVGNIRLVCKQWKASMTTLYRRPKGSRRVGLPAPLIHWDNCAKGLPFSEMPAFLKVMGESDMIPFQSYQFGSDVIAHGREKVVNDFMRICGPETVSLFHVIMDGGEVEDFEVRDLPPSTLDLEKFRTIEICFLRTWPGGTFCGGKGWKHGFGSYMEYILSEAKKLREFKFYAQFLRDSLDPRDDILYPQFGEGISGSLPGTAKSLALHMPFHDSTLMALMERGLKLEEFAITCYYPMDRETFLKFLVSQAASLRFLQILKSEIMPDNLVLEFPCLEKLDELEMQDVVFPSTFSFPRTFPKLRSLGMKEWVTEGSFIELLGSAKKAAPTLKKLRLPYSFPMAPHVRRLSQAFPNLTELHLSQSDDLEETLQQVFTHCCDIEALYILYGSEMNADSALSGVPREDCDRICRLPDFGDTDLREVQRKPFILNLTKLKTLEVKEPTGIRQDGRVLCIFHQLTLTDFSAHFLFLKMESLRELRLTALHRMSRRCVSRLREMINVTITNDVLVKEDDDSASDDFGADL